jgi:vacuolar-type H+-ATPase subunit B/Vma2
LAELSGENQQQSNQSQNKPGEILTDSEDIKPLSEQVDERPINQEVSQEDYENADETLKELYKKGERLKSIDELVDIEEVSKQSNRFTEFNDQKEENVFAKEIREGLSDPESAKKAIVYAEILNRKY